MVDRAAVKAVLARQDAVFGDVVIKKHENFDSVMAEQTAVRDDWK